MSSTSTRPLRLCREITPPAACTMVVDRMVTVCRAASAFSKFRMQPRAGCGQAWGRIVMAPSRKLNTLRARLSAAAPGRPGAAVRRNASDGLSENLSRGELVLDRLGVEAVATLVGRLGLRIHEEGDLIARRIRQLDVRRIVVGEPIHLPTTKELGPRLLDLGIAERRAAVLFEHQLAHVGRVDGYPAVGGRVELGAAVLVLADVAAPAQALVLRGLDHAHPVDVTGRDADGAHHAHEERVEIRALAPKVAGLEQCLDIPETAAPNLRIAEGVLYDPLVDGAGLVDGGRGFAGRPLRIEDARTILLVSEHTHDARITRPALPQALLIVGIRHERQGHPSARGARGLDDFEA